MTDPPTLPWIPSWSAIRFGAAASVVAVVLFGLMGTALGAHKAGAEGRITTWTALGLGALAFAIFSSFLAFAIGGWIAAKGAGVDRSESAMLHGAASWVVAVLILLVLASFGGSFFSGWFAGLVPSPLEATPGQAADPNAAIAARNASLAAVGALLVGLVGAAIGGWIAAGEPMTFTHYRTRSRVSVRRSP